jgi:hypothetical protein
MVVLKCLVTRMSQLMQIQKLFRYVQNHIAYVVTHAIVVHYHPSMNDCWFIIIPR